jgi:transcriptional regulator with XRE-family HTH domain
MKERLVQLLDLEQLTPSKFADIIGVQRSSVSHVISGRNNPSFDFLQKTLTAFPGLNAEWLMLGKGSMYEQMGRGVPGTLFDTPQEPVEVPDESHISPSDPPAAGVKPSDPPASESDEQPETVEPQNDLTKNMEEKVAEKKKSDVVQVMIFYDDDTFRSFRPTPNS